MSFDRISGPAIIAATLRDPDSGRLVFKDSAADKRTHKMPRSMVRRIVADMRAERLAREATEPPREPLPF